MGPNETAVSDDHIFCASHPRLNSLPLNHLALSITDQTDIPLVSSSSATLPHKHLPDGNSAPDEKHRCLDHRSKWCSNNTTITGSFICHDPDTFYRPQGNVFTGVCHSVHNRSRGTRSLLILVTMRSVRILLECFLVFQLHIAFSFKTQLNI